MPTEGAYKVMLDEADNTIYRLIAQNEKLLAAVKDIRWRIQTFGHMPCFALNMQMEVLPKLEELIRDCEE